MESNRYSDRICLAEPLASSFIIEFNADCRLVWEGKKASRTHLSSLENAVSEFMMELFCWICCLASGISIKLPVQTLSSSSSMNELHFSHGEAEVVFLKHDLRNKSVRQGMKILALARRT